MNLIITNIARRVNVTLLAGAAASTPLLHAQTATRTPDAEPLPDVVITATRAPKAIDKIPGAVMVIGQRELEGQYTLADDPSQALAIHVPSFSPSRQKMSAAGESLRGRVPLILLDGVPQSNPLRAGMREGYFADTAVIERVEVINGASAIQGMGATGGIINYITRSPKKNGTEHTAHVRMSNQFRSDSLDWKTGYSLAHKSDSFDLFGYAGVQRRGVGYDGRGRRLGLETVQGDTNDAGGHDLFLKIGKSFGDQRVSASYNRFKMEGDGDYRNVNAVLAQGIPTTAVEGTPPGAPARNAVETGSVEYRHDALAGGRFTAQLFKQDFASLYGATNTATFQDARIAPVGSLYDQSEIIADKYGAKLTYVRPDTLVQGLEVTAGFDLLHDSTRQQLSGTNRTWVPELNFTSRAPFAQFEYEVGPVTLRTGVRREDAKLDVDSYTTLASYGGRLVLGGQRSFTRNVRNIGAVWRFAPQWSMFVSSAEGFGLPDVGLVLRAVNRPGQSVASLFDMEPVVTRNNEIGVNWRGRQGNLGGSYYDSRSKLGTALRINSAGIGQLDRVPTHVHGWELVGDWRLDRAWTFTGSHARAIGKTATTAGAPIDVELGGRQIGPAKTVLGANWRLSPDGQLRLQATHLADRDINAGRMAGTAILEEHFKGYTLLDLVGGLQTRWGKVGVGIDNLLDRQYIHYYSQSANSREATAYFAGRGRTLSVNWSRGF
ncbi:TonB-dependent receptor [Pseudoduganella namucuonensis]|nr:TonB-dependent receptor [Pseudoduganella namucuonensis]